MLDYTELHCVSSFSFLRGASAPDVLAATAVAQGYRGLALTDECSLAGVVRAWDEIKENPDFRFIVGSELPLANGPRLILLAENLTGYQTLSQLITRARRDSPKGHYHLAADDLPELPGLQVLWAPGRDLNPDTAAWLRDRFDTVHLAMARHREADDRPRFTAAKHLAQRFGLQPVAVGEVHQHTRECGPLQDVVTALRLGKPVTQCGRALFANHERYLRPLAELETLYPKAWLRQTRVIAERCDFKLDSLRYQYPAELVPPGETPTTHLRALTDAGLAQRWPNGVPSKVRDTVTRELALIADMAYESFSHRRRHRARGAASQHPLSGPRQRRQLGRLLRAGHHRGLARLHRSAVRALRVEERGEPPDIDVDFEHQRREEIIQYIYRKYGRDRAALAATVIHWRPRSALRDVGKVLEMPGEVIDALARNHTWWDTPSAGRCTLMRWASRPAIRVFSSG